jgi:hypothetical protein
MHALFIVAIPVLVLLPACAARDLVAVTAFGRDYAELAGLVIESADRWKRACSSDADIDVVIVADEAGARAMTTSQPWQHVFALPVDGDARSESVFMARFETVKWPRFWQYQRVLQIDADTLVNGCLAPVFARVTPRQLHAHPALYAEKRGWSLPESRHPLPRTPFNSGAFAFVADEFMAGHLLLMRAWIRDEIALGTEHYTDQSFVNVYMDRHGLVNTTGALTNSTIMVRPSHGHKRTPPYAQPLLHFIAGGLNKTQTKHAEMSAYIHAADASRLQNKANK